MEKVEMNKDMKLSELYGLRLSPHFTLGELTKTQYVTKDGNIRCILRSLHALRLVEMTKEVSFRAESRNL